MMSEENHDAESKDQINREEENLNPLEGNDDSKDVENEEIEAQKEKIEEDLKNLAKQYESLEEEKPRPMINQLLLTFGFIFGPILYSLLMIIESWDLFREITVPASGIISVLLLVNVLFVSWRKSKLID